MSLNRVFLLGNLGADPELRYTQAQNPVCTMRIATTDRRKDSATGEWVEQTEWHNIVAWGKTAENCNQYLKKGRQIFVEGKLQTRKWQDKDGNNRYTTEVIANTIQFVGGRGEGAGAGRGAPAADAGFGSDMPSAAAIDAATGGAGGGSVAFDDDDIPF